MRKKFIQYLFVFLSIAVIVSGCHKPDPDVFAEFEYQLSKLPHVVSVTREESHDFAARYKVFFEQPIDHDHPGAGKFNQLVYVCLAHPDSLNVLITEGYSAFDAKAPAELTSMFNANQIVVEHRYYGESTIDDPSFKYNNADNSCDDLHEIVTALKKLLSRKWVSTGVSKSGLTCNMYRAWYPNDVDVTVPYSSPLCNARYDTRLPKALEESIGTPEDRAKMTAFQREALTRRDVLAAKFDAAAKAQNITFKLPARQLWDLHMMDFQVAFWAYSYDINEMPDITATDDEIFNYIINIDGPDAWDMNYDVNKYYTEAYLELGHYLNSKKDLEDLLIISDDVYNDFLKYTLVPDNIQNTFSTSMRQKVDNFLRNTDAKYIFIYGGWDPWCYVGIGEEYVHDNIYRYVNPGTGHRTKISSFAPCTQQEIRNKLYEWLR